MSKQPRRGNIVCGVCRSPRTRCPDEACAEMGHHGYDPFCTSDRCMTGPPVVRCLVCRQVLHLDGIGTVSVSGAVTRYIDERRLKNRR